MLPAISYRATHNSMECFSVPALLWNMSRRSRQTVGACWAVRCLQVGTKVDDAMGHMQCKEGLLSCIALEGGSGGGCLAPAWDAASAACLGRKHICCHRNHSPVLWPASDMPCRYSHDNDWNAWVAKSMQCKLTFSRQACPCRTLSKLIWCCYEPLVEH